MPDILWNVRNVVSFYDKGLLVSRITSNLTERPLSSAYDCLFNTFSTVLRQEGRSSTRNLRTSHVLVTETHLSRLLVHAWQFYLRLYKFIWLNYTKLSLRTLIYCLEREKIFKRRSCFLCAFMWVSQTISAFEPFERLHQGRMQHYLISWHWNPICFMSYDP
jgi:hypothetical protein